MAYNPSLPAGGAAAASSAPVAIATDQIQDAIVTGASTAASGNNALLASAGTGALDTLSISAGGSSYRSIFIQVNASAGISAGALTLEGSNDGSNWFVMPFLQTNIASTFQPSSGGAFTVAASNTYAIAANITGRYVRYRVSTAITGGTVQCVSRFSTATTAYPIISVVQNTASQLGVTAVLSTQVPYSLNTAASTNAASIRGFASILFEVTVSNPTASAVYVKFYNKGSAPTVGTDVPVLTLPVAAGTTGVFQFGPYGKRFSTGLAIAATGGMAVTDTANAPAGAQISLTYGDR